MYKGRLRQAETAGVLLHFRREDVRVPPVLQREHSLDKSAAAAPETLRTQHTKSRIAVKRNLSVPRSSEQDFEHLQPLAEGGTAYSHAETDPGARDLLRTVSFPGEEDPHVESHAAIHPGNQGQVLSNQGIGVCDSRPGQRYLLL